MCGTNASRSGKHKRDTLNCLDRRPRNCVSQADTMSFDDNQFRWQASGGHLTTQGRTLG